MDVDDSTESWISLDALDHVYLGLDDDIEYDPLSSIGPDVLDTIPNQSLPVYSDDIALFNDLALYLRPDDELIDCDEDLACADMDSNSLATQERSLSAHVSSPRHHLAPPELINEELYAMVWEFQPLGSYDHTGCAPLFAVLTGWGFGMDCATALSALADGGPPALLGLFCGGQPSAESSSASSSV
ncbi:hypothetical protein BD769DRAFT_1663821 [Suillus cothurnatus]|nr:hypothetical protein BD769DRAFT_1663821 [Suillus cothurnatus]